MIGHVLIFLCIAGVSIPSFFFASTYLDIFAVKLGLIGLFALVVKKRLHIFGVIREEGFHAVGAQQAAK